jgi:hypothetical protein
MNWNIYTIFIQLKTTFFEKSVCCYFSTNIFFSVKYIREVSPYFRKSSALNDLGWGGQEAQRDAARVQLKTTFFEKSVKTINSNNSTKFEVN